LPEAIRAGIVAMVKDALTVRISGEVAAGIIGGL